MVKKNVKIIVSIGVACVAAAILLAAIWRTAGGGLDVVGRQSVASLDAVFQSIPSRVTADEAGGRWSLAAPDGTARFLWSKVFSEDSAREAMLETDAKPFVDAGLDPARLPGHYAVQGGRMTVGTKLGGFPQKHDGGLTPLASYAQIVEGNAAAVNYHAALDHFGVKLGDGNMFEWAKDLKKITATGADQDKDMVFVLNPEPLIAAGVDPFKVEGWAYVQVAVEENGKAVQVYRFLKPFNLK